jgi:deoxyribose-phosphate aldolase
MISREELDALTEAITRSILARLESEQAAELACSCHGTAASRCPNLIRGLVDGGAERLGLHAGPQHGGTGLGRMIDHTLLKPDATEPQIRKLCEEAAQHGFATVCINPTWVRLAARLLQGTSVGVCTVVGFPLGANTSDVKIYETRRALFDGATEIDMVINVGALKSKDYELVESDILGVVCCTKEAGALSKVILETALLDREEKIKASTLAAAAGADFVKTSTGFGPGGATVEDVALMRQVVGDRIGVKAAGGVRDAVTAAEMVKAGATRIGASAGVRILQEAGSTGRASGSGY